MAEQVCTLEPGGHSCSCDRRLSALREHWPEYLMEATLLIAIALMLTVLSASNHRRFTGYTPSFAGLLVALYTTLGAPSPACP